MNSLGGLDRDFRAQIEWFLGLIRWAAPSVRYRITSGRRTRAEQASLYRQSARSPYPVAPPGKSRHESGLAVDIVFQPRQFEQVAGEAWESLGGRWGGRFPKYDGIHFEAPR